MSKNIFPWVKPLGLSSSNFANRPEGADALVWGLKNNVINPDEYLTWATEYYQLPAIKAEFFSMAVDFTLMDKYTNLYDWHMHCYPIYSWQGTLFVACLEPPKEQLNMKVCYVIAPFHALESAWQKHENAKPGVPIPTEQIPMDSVVPQNSTLAPTDEADVIDSAKPMEMTATEVLHQDEPEPASSDAFPDLDLNAPLQDLDPTREQDVVEEPPAPEIPQPEPAVATPPKVAAPAAPSLDGSALDFGDLKKEMGVDDEQAQATDQPVPSQPKEEVGVLDFSSIGDEALHKDSTPVSEEPEDESFEEIQAQPQSDDSDDDLPAPEVTQTKVDANINNLTSATQTIHMHNQTVTATKNDTQTPPLPFEELTIKGMSLEGEKTQIDRSKQDNTRVSKPAEKPPAPPVKQAPPPPVQKAPVPPVNEPPSADALPSLDDLKQHATSNPAPAPGLQDSDINLDAENANLGKDDENEESLLDDDYTPVPVLSQAQKEAQERRRQEALQKEQQAEKSRLRENTITDHAQPVVIPPDKLISDQDLKQAANLDDASDLKSVVAHIFSHLKRDYERLMWVGLGSEGQYFVDYVKGDWKITELAWKMHVNITNPNIFRVAYKSGHPFHGEVSSNPYNDKYFDWWLRGKTPNFATVYPVSIDETIIGFVCGFTKGEEFDEVGSLKKVQNLLTICKKALKSHAPAQAA